MENQKVHIKTSLSFIFVLCATSVYLLCAVLNRHGLIALGNIVLNTREVMAGFVISFSASFDTATLLVKAMGSVARKLTRQVFIALTVLVGLLFRFQ